MNLEEFAAILQAPPADLLNAVRLPGRPARGPDPGGLHPAGDPYRSRRGASPRAWSRRLLTTSATRLTQEIRDGIAAQGLTIDEAVIMASIVEREAVLDEERPLIAGVYINRFRPTTARPWGLLNADPTLQYGL